jgi:hypothetical protein
MGRGEDVSAALARDARQPGALARIVERRPIEPPAASDSASPWTIAIRAAPTCATMCIGNAASRSRTFRWWATIPARSAMIAFERSTTWEPTLSG